MLEAFLISLLFSLSALFSLYAVNYYYLIWQSYKQPITAPTNNDLNNETLPKITIQLPMYREKFVARRILEACGNLDYPKEKLQILVCDDSDDETVQIVDSTVAELRKKGLNIDVIRRATREGFKAGALREALKKTDGEFIAIFDADYVPGPDFLKRCLPYLMRDERLAFVETRLGHLNRETNWVSRTVALAIDGYCFVELIGRSCSGLYFNMNGTSVVIRRRALQDECWETDTLTEDLDLAYRLQTRGWKGLYLPSPCVLSEVPARFSIFKAQQFRWSKGYFQCLRKNWRRITKDENASRVKKIMGLIHLSAYLFQPLVILNLFVMGIAQILFARLYEFSFWTSGMEILYSIVMGLITFSPVLMYYVAARKQNKIKYIGNIPALALLALATAVSNSVATLEGILNKSGGMFVRTPKYGLMDGSQSMLGPPSEQLECGSTVRADLVISLLALLVSIVVFVRSPSAAFYLLVAGASWLYSGLATKLNL